MTAATSTRPADQPAIRLERPAACPVCEHDGLAPAYRGLEDRLFGAAGSWNFDRCGRCGSLLLVPRPIAADLRVVYTDHYSRRKPAAAGVPPSSWRHRLSHYLTRGFLSASFGYHSETTVAQRTLGFVLNVLPRRREAIRLNALQLPYVPHGRLLDIGCGLGDVLAQMTQLGWLAEGIDTDPNVVGQARARGLQVQLATLEGQGYADGTFDAVSAKHVLEHVAEPVAFLTECRRVVKPGGRVVIFTPNLESLAHRVFGRHWLGLDAPRHLVLFTESSLRLAAERAGLAIERLETTGRITGFNWRVSYEMAIRRRTMYATRAFPESRLVEQLSALLIRPAILARAPLGDEIFMIARRR